MLKKIAAGYKKLFSTAAKIVLLALLCLAISFIFVWPLWKWAMTSPSSYSTLLLILVALLLLWCFYRSIRKNGINAFLLNGLKLLIILGGIAGCILLVLKGHRIISLAVLFAAFILYGIVAFGIKNRKSQEKN